MTGRGWAGLRCGLMAVGILCAGIASAQGVVAVGPVSPAHGFPLWYEDSNGLRLDLCLDNNGLCLETLPNPAAPASIPDNFPDEAFWWAAEAEMPTNNGGDALLVLALEAAWLNETPAVGEQIVFGRIRVRVDNLVAGQSYRVIHPFGERTFVAENGGDRGINFTEDIGCLSAPCDFSLALTSNVGPFLVWDPAVPPAAPAGYIGNPAVPHPVVGSPTGNNFFRIEGPNVGGPGVNAIQTNLFAVQGKISAAPPPVGELALSSTVLDFGAQFTGGATASRELTVTNVGGGPLTVNTLSIAGANAADFAIASENCIGAAIPSAGTCTVTVQFTPANIGPRQAELQILADDQATPHLVALRGEGVDPLGPVGAVGPVNAQHGFPDWYQDLNGVRLELCLENNGLCLETLPNPAAPPSVPGNFPDEAFWWAGEASIDTPTGVEALLVMAMEAAWFNEVPEVGQQMSFGRVRVRIDGLTAGETYTVTHPYGTDTLVADELGEINVTEDIGCGNAPCDFAAALDSRITHFLRWDPNVLPLPPAGYIGDPNVLHPVVGSPTGNNFFRVEGPNVGGPGINLIETDLFTIQGKLATAGNQQLALSPSPVDFGNVPVGTTAGPVEFVIQSVGTGPAPVTLGTLSVAGINCGDFTAVHACSGDALATGETCSVQVSFSPQALGTRSCVLLIPNDAEGNPHSVVLSGFGTDDVAQPVLSVPATLAFGNVAVGASADQTLTVTNTGGAPLNVGTPAITGANAGDFTINANTCTAPVAPAGTCSLTVRFTPAAAGARAAVLSLPSNDPAGTRTVSLSGTGVLNQPVLSAPATLAFGNVNVGASADQTLTVTNTGTAALNVGAPAIAGANAGDFAVVANACTAPVAPAGTCTLTVRFTPAAAGARAATLTLPSNDPAGPHTVALSGTGVVLQPVLSVPATLAFGSVNLGANAVQSLTVANTGAAPLNVGTPAITGANAGDFTLVTNGCTAAVAPGGTCTLTLRFTPSAAGARAATLTLPSNDPAGPRTVALSGTGVAVAVGPRLTFEPDPLDFGNAVLGVIAQRTVTVRNTGTANLLLGGAFLNGPHNADWAVLANNCGGRNLAPNATCTIVVGFRPTALGLRVTTMSVNSTDPANPRQLAISGNGVTVGGGNAPVLTTDANVAFGPVGIGVIASRNFVLRNTGTAPLSVGAITLGGPNAGDYRVSGNPCTGTQIAPAGTCTLVLTFRPPVAGARAATLSITHNAPGSPRLIPITGEGQAPGTLTATPSPLAFGTVSLGSLARRNVTLTNTGSGTITFDGAPIVGANPQDFAITRVTCGPTLAAGASCQVEITFRPRAFGPRSATLRVQSNAVGNPTLVPMTGQGG